MTNFKTITIKGLVKDETLDVSKELGNALYYQSEDLKGSELGRKIYFSEREVELTDEEKQMVKDMAERVYRSWVVREAINRALE